MSSAQTDGRTLYISETLEREHEIRFQLSAAAIDESAGIIRGCSVAQAGVVAVGKYVLLDKNGQLTRDPELAVRKLPVVTDEKTLDTLLAAAQDAGGVVKVRSDHNDSLGARAGFAANFRMVRDADKPRVATDLNLNSSYRDREIVLETAKKTPALLGLSIDFLPEYEILPDKALMRVRELYAVDIVDEGAVTHDGLFLSRGVDKKRRGKESDTNSKLSTTMADDKDKKTEPSLAEVLAAVAALNTAVAECSAGLKKLQGAPADKPKEEEVPAAMKAALDELKTSLAAVKEEQAKLAKEKAALGIKTDGTDAALKGGADAAAEGERARLAAEKDKGSKSYLQLVDEAMEGKKYSKRSEAHTAIMRLHPDKYAEHLSSKGVVARSNTKAA